MGSITLAHPITLKLAGANIKTYSSEVSTQTSNYKEPTINTVL